MKVSKVATATARRIFRLSQADGRLDDARLSMALRKLVDGQPRGYRGILHALRRLVRLEAERRHVTVESATALAPAERERVMAGLAEKYGSNLTFEFREDSGLLGGMRVQVGSDVFDGSVKGRLARLSEAF
jgi:F-type H+-transporting ATPase subunit delta